MTDMLIDNLIEYGVFYRSVVLIIDDDLSTFCLLTGYVFVFERCAFNLFATLHGLLWVAALGFKGARDRQRTNGDVLLIRGECDSG